MTHGDITKDVGTVGALNRVENMLFHQEKLYSKICWSPKGTVMTIDLTVRRQ